MSESDIKIAMASFYRQAATLTSTVIILVLPFPLLRSGPLLFLYLLLNNPRCHGNKVWGKIGYNSACIRDIFKIFASNREFWAMVIK